MPRLSPEEIAELSVAERVQLAEDIWDSIAADPASLPITEAQKLELDRRLSTFEAEPSRTQPWSEGSEQAQRAAVTALVEFTPEAEADISEAYSWYRNRGLGLGEEFLRSLDACLDGITRFPDSSPVVHRNVRRNLLRASHIACST